MTTRRRSHTARAFGMSALLVLGVLATERPAVGTHDAHDRHAFHHRNHGHHGTPAAGTFTAFGPRTFRRGPGAPDAVSSTFSVGDPAAPYTLQIKNGGRDGDDRVGSAVIRLNGAVVVRPDRFHPHVDLIHQPVSLRASNTLSVELRGKPGGTLTIEIVGVDHVPPVLHLAAQGEPVILSLAYSDATAGVDPTTLRVALDGADITRQCEVGPAAASCSTASLAPGPHQAAARIRDRAGNRATVRVAFDVTGGVRDLPTLTNLVVPATVVMGGAAGVTFDFAAPGGDIVQLVRTRADEMGQQSTEEVPARLIGIRGTSGQASFLLSASALTFGANTFTLRLRDGLGRLSDPVGFTVRLVAAGAGGGLPVIESFAAQPVVWSRPPAGSYGPNGTGLTGRLRPPFVLAYRDPDADVERARVRVTDPLGQVTTSELGATSLRLTGPAGVIEHPFLTLRHASALGAYTVEVTLIDRSGHLSDTAAAMVELRESGGAAPLAIAGVAPSAGGAGTEVVLTGTGFDAGDPAENQVSLAQIVADILEVTPTSLRVVVPAGAGSGKFVVRNRLGVAVSDALFTVPTSVSVAPTDARVVVGDTVQLEAAVVSSFFTAVTWSVEGIPGGDAAVGTITASGLYTAPASVPPGGTVTVSATLGSSPGVTGQATVRILPPPATPGVATVLAAVGGAVRSVEGGALVSIPPGALRATTTVSVTERRGAAAPNPGAGRRLLGAVELGPSGTTFDRPVIVTVPLARFVLPGTRLPAAFVAPDGTFVRDEGIQATVLDNGEQASASIGHFSTIALDEPAPVVYAPGSIPVPRIDEIAPASGEEGRRVPVRLRGANLTADLSVQVLGPDRNPSGDIVPGTLYASGADVGVLLSIRTIADLPAGASRDYVLRLERFGGLQAAEATFTVTGLDELVVTGGTTELGEPGADPVTRRFSEVRVALPGRLRSMPTFMTMEVTGPVIVDGPVLVDGARGASGIGQEPGVRVQHAGGGGRGRDDNGCLELPFGITPGADGFDCSETENWGQDADRCTGGNRNNPRSDADCLRVSSHPEGLGGRPGFNEDNLSLGDLLSSIASAIGCAVTLGVGCIISTGANIFDVIDAFTIDETITLGGNGFGSFPGSGGGGGGGGGKVDGLAGGGGGAGGEPGRNLRIVTADRLVIQQLVTAGGGDGGDGGIVQECGGDSADLSLDPGRIDEIIRCSGEAGAFVVRLKDQLQGAVLSGVQDGISAFVQGQLAEGASIGDILANLASTFGADLADDVAASLEDPSPAGIASAIVQSLFGDIKLTNLVNTGGGGGGGAGGGLNLAAGLGVLQGVGGRTAVRPGHGGFGGVTLVDDKNSNLFHFVYRTTKPSEAFGGSRTVSDPFDNAGIPVFDPFTIQTGVTDRTLLRDVRVNALGIADIHTDPFTLHPIRITVTCEATGTFTNTIVARPGGSYVVTADLLLCPGFNQVAADLSVTPGREGEPASMHELLQKRILVMAVDSDGDGLGDRDEADLGTDPLRRDTDGDGLEDGQEILRGADPRRPDTDGDGLLDGDEVARGTDPTRADTDGDGVSDAVEVLLGSDPRSAASRPVELPDGLLLGASDNRLVALDAGTGSSLVVSQLLTLGQFGLAFDANATLYVALGDRLAVHEPITGTSTPVGVFGPGIEVRQLAYNPRDGQLYGVDLGPAFPTGQLLRIDRTTGAATRVGAPGPDPIHALAFDQTGVLFAALAGGGGSDRLVRLSPATGEVVAEVGPIGTTPVYGLAFHGGVLFGAHWLSDTTSELLGIDPATGLGTPIAAVARPLFGLAVKPCPMPCLAPAVAYPVGGAASSSPTAIAVADLNGDGILDVVTANAGAGSVSVLIGNGDGTFQPALDVPVGVFPTSLAVGDLDGDGVPDVVVGARQSQTVVALRNDGRGRLTVIGTFPVGGTANSLNAVGVGSFTGDAVPDVVAGAFIPNAAQVSLLAGDGTGRFGPPVLFPASRFGILGLAVADLDRDGRADVVTAHFDGRVAVLLGDGAGTLTRVQELLGGFFATAVVVADLDGDGAPDVAISDGEGQSVNVMRNDGSGRLLGRVRFAVGASLPAGIAAGDVSGDGRPDLVTANLGSSVSVLLGNGAGGFAPARRSPFGVGQQPAAVAVGDLDGDGYPDLVVADQGLGSVLVLMNQPSF